MSSGDTATSIARGPVAWRAIPGFLVVAGVDGTVVEVDGPGAEIWALVDEPTTVDAIASTLAARYEAPLDAVTADVNLFIDRLAAAGYLQVGT